MNIDEALKIIEDVYGAFGPQDSVPQEELDAASRRLGVSLPVALQVFYRRVGRSDAVRQGNRLAEPVELTVSGGHLVFFHENQDVCAWGVELQHLGADDPPVSTSYVDASGVARWAPEFPSVSEFCCVQALWQATWGGLPFCASDDDASMGGRLREGARTLGSELLHTNTTRAWMVHGCVLVMGTDSHFGLAGRDPNDFFLAAERLGVAVDDWSYYSPRDD